MKPQIGLIGIGSMGGAILEGIIDGGIVQSDQMFLIEADCSKRDLLLNRGFHVTDDISTLPSLELIIIAIKPQQFAEIASELKGKVNSSVIVSVMAGVKSGIISEELQSRAGVIRCMPNLACRIRKGMTAIYCDEKISKDTLIFVEKIFKTVGEVIQIDEEFFDVVTALSGSGPGYLFRCVESLAQAGKENGLPEKMSQELARYVCIGSGGLLEITDESVSNLREGVTSRGGTTEAGLKALELSGIDLAFSLAIKAAAERSYQLSNG